MFLLQFGLIVLGNKVALLVGKTGSIRSFCGILSHPKALVLYEEKGFLFDRIKPAELILPTSCRRRCAKHFVLWSSCIAESCIVKMP